MRRCVCVLGSLLLMLLFVPGASFSQEDALVAKIGEKNITLSDFNKILTFYDPEKLKMIENNMQVKEQLLQQMVQALVIAQTAKQSGFDAKPDIKEHLELLKNSFIANEYLKREIIQKVTVSDNEVKTYYDTNKDEFKTPEMVRARHILFLVEASATPEEKKKVNEKAEATLKKIKAGENFDKLASELSEDPGSKPKGGDIGLVARGKTVKPFEDALFSLKPGEISGVIETKFGYHIIKAEERKDASIEPFDAVKEKIRQKISQERVKAALKEFIDKEMKDAKAEVFPEALSGKKK
jgi:peptidyl-prolyl cis-trans isomerase C